MSVIVSSLRCLSRSIELTANAALSVVSTSAQATNQLTERASNFVASSSIKYAATKVGRQQELSESISESLFFRKEDHESWLKDMNAKFAGKSVEFEGKALTPEELYKEVLKKLEANSF